MAQWLGTLAVLAEDPGGNSVPIGTTSVTVAKGGFN